jgi:hypothetical protein
MLAVDQEGFDSVVVQADSPNWYDSTAAIFLFERC